MDDAARIDALKENFTAMRAEVGKIMRTGMANTEMTCAIPANRLHEVVEKLRGACSSDKIVASYASDDSKRFGQYLG